MRFLSKYRLTVQVQPYLGEAYASGIVRTVQEPIYATFTPGVTPDERELAMRSFSFEGFYQEQDEATVVDLSYRITVYDTVEAEKGSNWPEGTREGVEQYLVGIAANFPYIIQVPATFAEAPWPRYDTYKGSTAQLVRKLVDEGYDLDEVLTYERASQNRADVIEAIETAKTQVDVLEEEVVG